MRFVASIRSLEREYRPLAATALTVDPNLFRLLAGDEPFGLGSEEYSEELALGGGNENEFRVALCHSLHERM